METVNSRREQRPKAAHAGQPSHGELAASLAMRLEGCVDRAFDSMGATAPMRDVIYWNLAMTKKVGKGEVMDKPAQFLEGLRAIYGDAGTAVFEFMLAKEIKREFGLTAAFDNQPIAAMGPCELIHLIAYAALESRGE